MVSKKLEARKLALCAFFISFLIQICLNLTVPCMRSLPDEMGAVALAADFAGYNWNYVLTHPSMYYGSGTSPLLIPFFLFIDDPKILYQCLLGVGALLRSMPAYISIRIAQKYYGICGSKSLLLMLGILCVFFSPTRATNIDNEPMLILLCWGIVYSIVALQHSERRRRIGYSILVALLLTVAQFSHTRALLYSISFIVLICIYKLFTKKMLVHMPGFCITYIIGILISTLIINILKNELFVNRATETVANTPDQVASTVLNNIEIMFSGVGIQSIVDIFLSNIWITFVFGCGIVIFSLFDLIVDTGKKIKLKMSMLSIKITDIYFPQMFCIVGFLISLAGLCVLWLPHGVAVHEEASNLSRGHFYLRYYGNFFGPCVLFFIIRLLKKSNWNEKKIIIIAIITVGISALYTVISYLGITTINYQYNIDWFYYFAPFSGMLNSWPNTIQTLSYFACATLVAVIILVVVYFFRKNINVIIAVLLCAFLWQYIYGVSRFDSPYANSENYYQSVNAIYELRKENKQLFENTEKIFYINSVYGPAYIVQFMIPDKEVITDLDLIDLSEDNVIISNEMLSYDLLNDDYEYVQLDENEILYVNGNKNKELLIDSGYVLNSIGSYEN